MGFEGVVPPVPTREQELNHIKKLEQNFLSQPNRKFYMNEALRTRKLADSANMNRTKTDWWHHFFIGALVSGIFIIPVGRAFHKFSSGVPHYWRPKQYFISDFDTTTHSRNLKALSAQLTLWLMGATGYAYYFTDFRRIDDETFENVKVIKIFE